MMDELKQEFENAMENYNANKQYGAPASSLAFDAGVVEGLKRALEIIEKNLLNAL